MNHWSDEEGETARGDQARAVMREPMGKEATRSADVSVYTRRRVSTDTCVQNGGGTHDEQDGDRVLATNGDEVGRVCVVAGPHDVDECAMVVSEVHWGDRGRARAVAASQTLVNLVDVSRVASEPKTCTESSALPRSRPLLLRRVLRPRPPPRSHRTRIRAPPLERPPARLARALA